MRIKIVVTEQGYRLEGYSNNRRERTPLATRDFPDKPLFVEPAEQKRRILDMMTRTGLVYAERNSAQRYTSISGGE